MLKVLIILSYIKFLCILSIIEIIAFYKKIIVKNRKNSHKQENKSSCKKLTKKQLIKIKTKFKIKKS